GPEVTAGMVKHPAVDMVTFTGSTAVGKQVMRACADSVKRVALELGGKSASIITDDVDPATTVDQVVAATGISLAGQTCGSRNRIVLPRSRHAEWREVLVRAAGGLVCGPPSDPAADVGPLATRQQRDRVEGFIRSGLDEGAELLVGG